MIIGIILTVACIYAALKIARSEQWMVILILYAVAVMLFATASTSKAWGDFNGGWGTTSFNVYEQPHANNTIQWNTGGWGNFWARLFGRGGSLMPAIDQ